MKNLTLIFVTAVFCANAFAAGVADDAFMPGATGTATGTPNTTPGQTQFPTYVPPPPPPPAPKPQGSINPAANQGQASQNGGAGANAAAGAALIAAGMALMSQPPTVPAGAALIAMGMLAMAQSDHDNNAAGQSAATAAASLNGLNKPTAAKNPDFGKGKGGFNDPAVAEGIKALNDAGYEITPNGLKGPDGTTIPNSAFNNPGSLANHGVNPDNVKAITDALGTVNRDTMGSGPKVASMGTSESGGGGGGGESSSKFNPDFSLSGKNKWGISDAARASMIAGKTVNFDGEPIGVRGSNIFEMIHVAYQKKRESQDFLDDAPSGAAVRAPASVQAPPVPLLVPAVGGTYNLPKARRAAKPFISNR